MMPVLSVLKQLILTNSQFMSDSDIASFSIFDICVPGGDCPFSSKTHIICKMLYNEMSGHKTMVYAHDCANLTLY